MNRSRILLSTSILFSFCFFGSIYSQETNSKINESNWLKISINLKNFYLVVNDDFVNSYYLTSGDSVLLRVGTHELRIVWRNINDLVVYANIRKDQKSVKRITTNQFRTNPKSSFQILENKQNINVISDAESDIYVDGEYKGTQYSELFLNPGKYELFIEHPEHGSLVKTLTVDHTEFYTIARYNQNINPIPTFQKFIPGISYISTHQYKKAAITYTGLVALTGVALYFNSDYNSKADLFKKQNQSYLQANTPPQAIALRLQAQNTLQEMETLNTKITWLTIGAIAWYGITTIDGFRKPKEGYKGAITLRPNLAYNNYSFKPELSVKIKF